MDVKIDMKMGGKKRTKMEEKKGVKLDATKGVKRTKARCKKGHKMG